MIHFQYDGSNGWPSSMEMPGGMYSDPRGGLDQLGHHSDAASVAAASHMNHAMHNHYAAIAAAAAANNHASNSIANNVMGGSQIPDALKRDKDAIYG